MPSKLNRSDETADYIMDDILQQPEPERKIPPDFLLPENHPRILHNQGLAIQDLGGLVDDAQREARGIELLFGKFQQQQSYQEQVLRALDEKVDKQIERLNWHLLKQQVYVIFAMLMILLILWM